MSTVTCPSCKTQNTEGSKFCNRCGTPLPRSTHITCPNCHSRNPRNLLYCDNCGTRLSMTGELSSEREEEKEPPPSERFPRAFSLPTREPGEELDSNRLMDWLRTGEEEPEEGAGRHAPANQDNTAEQAAVLDDWLSELSDMEPSGSEGEEGLSDWFQDDVPSEKDRVAADFADWLLESEEGRADEGLPDWLSDYDTETEEEDLGGTAEEEALPDWLTDYDSKPAEADSTAPADEALPDWLSDLDAGGETPTLVGSFGQLDDTETADEELPDWLSDLDAGGETPTLVGSFGQLDDTETADAESGFDWLDDFDAEEATPTLADSFEQPQGEDALLSWLSDFDSEDEETAPAAADKDLLPDWLNDLDVEAAESKALSDTFDRGWQGSGAGFTGLLDEAFKAEADDDEEASPDWEVTGAGFTGLLDDAFEGETSGDEDATPDWEKTGAGFTGLLDEAFEEETDDDEESAMPDWLAEMPSQDFGFGVTSERAEEDRADTFIDFDVADYNERPDWLADVAPDEELPLEETVEAAETTADEDLPGWLSDFPEEAESLDTIEDVDWLAALTHGEVWPEAVDDEEIAAQLDEWEEEPEESTGHSKELKGVPKELAGSGLPDWLQDDMPEFDSISEEEEPGYFGDEDDQLVQEALPDWLQQMKPADLEQSGQNADLEADFALTETRDEWQNILENMPAASPEALPGAGTLSTADIPAWLQALRPRDFGGEEEIAEADEPPETEGPLAGMRGVLPVAPAIVTPVAAAAAPVRYTISKEQQQQISLLHQLTHEEPVKTKQVAQRKAAAFSPVWRLILGLLLLLVVAAGALLPGTAIELPETALPVSQSALDTFNTIDPLSGQTVLVAFEYTPAMAGELDPIALMLLSHLVENDNRVLTISQSAAGTAVARQITGEVSGLESGAFGLLTGEAVGLSSLGSCLNSADDCGLLLGTEPDSALQEELADIGLIIILTSDRNSLVNWIEQVEAQNDVPVIAAVTQPLGPLTYPYLSSGQLEGSINGIPAASAYEKRLRGLDGSASEQFSAQTIVMGVVIVALAAAAIFYGLAGFARRGPKKGSG